MTQFALALLFLNLNLAQALDFQCETTKVGTHAQLLTVTHIENVFFKKGPLTSEVDFTPEKIQTNARLKFQLYFGLPVLSVEFLNDSSVKIALCNYKSENIKIGGAVMILENSLITHYSEMVCRGVDSFLENNKAEIKEAVKYNSRGFIGVDDAVKCLN